MTKPSTIAGVDRALNVLDLFAEDRVTSLGVTEIAKRLDLSKAVVHRILGSLRSMGYVAVDASTRRYVLGSRVAILGLIYLDRLDVVEIARSALPDLSERTGETATLSLRSGWSRVYVDQVLPHRDIQMVVRLGSSHALHAGASSKAILAFLPELEIERYLGQADLVPLTDRTIADAGALRAELRSIRERGFATSIGERQADAASVAAPVLDHQGRPLAVMSISGPRARFEDEMKTCSQVLCEVTERLSRRMGAGYAKATGGAVRSAHVR